MNVNTDIFMKKLAIMWGVFAVSLISLISGRFALSQALSGLIDQHQQLKLRESAFYCVWHSVSTFINTALLLSSRWFTGVFSDPLGSLCTNFRTHAMTEAETLYYQTTLSFWFCSFLLLFWESRRKDFMQMVFHHVATIALVFVSLHLRLFRFGQVVLLLHDVVDVFLYAAKTLHYFGLHFHSELLFGCFAALFLLCRLIAFPALAILPGWRCALDEFSGGRVQDALELQGLLLPALLTLLFGLHVFWFSLILKMAKKIVDGKQLGGDVRSDDEDNDNEHEH